MHSVEQIKTVADDGRTVPTENGNAGEQSETDNGSAAESQEGVKREWEALIASPKFHALYTEHISDIIKKRLKSARQSDALLERAAGLLGLHDPEQLPVRIGEMLSPAQRDWAAEESAVREKYPEFDLQNARKDPAFISLLDGFAAHPDVPLTRLYELHELERLTKTAAQNAATKAASQIVGAMQLRHQRPHENGVFGISPDARRVSRLTRAQRAVLAERAAKGEHITF